ncbi:hypothetical protein KAFR_0D00930 [Kazachstania africana CBS 2517]|uniref:Major facilitator superfamily (MFS) profile domain-containing protein n=1 Tax=Kazachstania africana (strain ATCC 22294 / BCRC 22015 / CBS 2517 / CECT 1963 / NBRC 1671 / NRRL Y-8276) TaxID=1071382 RepID=H2ATP0_KAZAF|nr:hypothetical protein KAFR_0D00930 [Kazachstania africana CBS 2517]CCF57740.1 hypothetical protein KAFR_0D00930 [Kazachstania africana CBS 2517]
MADFQSSITTKEEAVAKETTVVSHDAAAKNDFSIETREDGDDAIVYDAGVRNIEIYAEYYTSKFSRFMYFFFLFLVAYAYGLDTRVRTTFATDATSSYKKHTLMSTVTCIKTIISAAGQIGFARSCDIFGRTSIFVFSIILYAVGTIVESQATTISKYAGGVVLYSLGHSGIVLVSEVLIADFSNLNWRVVAAAAPMLPNVINTWISGNIVADLGDHWKWGIGLWAIVFPVCCIPLLFILLHMKYLAQYKDKRPELKRIWTLPKGMTKVQYLIETLFWRVDVVGLILLAATFGLILIPFTLAEKKNYQWKKASYIVPEVLGWAVSLPLYCIWEKFFARFPLTPLATVKDRGIYGALLVSLFIDFVYYMQHTYLYTVLYVAFNNTTSAATRINNLYSFVGVITSFFLGFVVVRLKKVKKFILFGIAVWIIAYGLFIRYRTGQASYVGSIAAICVLGFGNGFLKIPARASIQASVGSHQKMAVITSLFLALADIGEAFGSAVAGAIWGNRMEAEIYKRVSNTTAAALAYDSPTKFVKKYKWGTATRMEVVAAYREVTLILYVVGICLCVPLLLCSFLLRDRKLEEVISYDMMGSNSESKDEIIEKEIELSSEESRA